MKIEVIQGDITKQKVDAIINSANTSLLGGGGIDGAIHKAAGHELLEECRKLNGCKTGEAKISKGYKLPSRHIIHTVGPVWRGGNYKEAELLASCYRSVFKVADQHDLRSLAFPSISTGAFNYPIEQAAAIAVREFKAYEKKQSSRVSRLLVICFDQPTYEIYTQLLGNNT